MSTIKRTAILLIFLLLFSLVQPAVPVTSAQQQSSRERKVGAPLVANPNPSPTPSPSPIPSPVLSPQSSPTPKIAQTTQTLAELQARISEVLQKPELAQAMVGIKVASLDSGRVLFESNARQGRYGRAQGRIGGQNACSARTAIRSIRI